MVGSGLDTRHLACAADVVDNLDRRGMAVGAVHSQAAAVWSRDLVPGSLLGLVVRNTPDGPAGSRYRKRRTGRLAARAGSRLGMGARRSLVAAEARSRKERRRIAVLVVDSLAGNSFAGGRSWAGVGSRCWVGRKRDTDCRGLTLWRVVRSSK